MLERPRLAACALVLALLPGTGFAMDLVQAYRDALASDAIVAAARAQLEAIRERVPQARAGLLPRVDANANLNLTTFDTNLAQRRDFDSQNYWISLSYPLYRRQNTEVFEQSKLGVTLAEHQFEAVRQDLMLRVSQAYFDVLAAQDTLETIFAQKRAISEQLASAKRNFEVGTATVTDQQEAQARFDLVLAQEYAANNDLEVKRAALAQLTGRVVPELRVLRPGVTLQPPQPGRQTAWTDVARSNNLVVQQALVASEIANREIDRQRYGHHPTLDLVGSTSYFKGGNTQLPNDFNSNSAQIGVQFVLPLYQGGLVDARVREAVSLREKAQQDLENARRVAEQAARQTFLGVNSGLAQVQALEAAERSSQLALDSNLLGYQVGVRNNIDVLIAQQQLYTTRRDLSLARYAVLLNGLRLKATVGALSEQDLQAVAALLDVPQPVNGTGGAAPASTPPPLPARPAIR